MGQAWFCDWCGKLPIQHPARIILQPKDINEDNIRYDLCPNCYDEIKEHLDNTKKSSTDKLM